MGEKPLNKALGQHQLQWAAAKGRESLDEALRQHQPQRALGPLGHWSCLGTGYNWL